jgi:hypothetical protein
VPTPASAGSAYDLVEKNGELHAYGGAGYYGSPATKHAPGIFVGAASTADGAGYWLATSEGGIDNFGDAHFFGSAVHVASRAPIVAISSTPDGGGYWLVSKTGAVYNYGDAENCGSGSSLNLGATVTAFAATPDGGGYWLVTAGGHVYPFGDAASYGSPVHIASRAEIVGIAPTADGAGYWLVGANGAVYNYGDARFFGTAVHKHLGHTAVSIAATGDGAGYWVAASSGKVFQFGDARFSGSLAKARLPHSRAVVGLMHTAPAAKTSTVSPYPHGDFGYDISNFQCARGGATRMETRGPSRSNVSVIGVTGWLDSANNSCLASEASWAKRAAGKTGGAYSLYLFMNSPGTNAAAVAVDASGPAGRCQTRRSSSRLACEAYNYGYNGAKDALAYAASRGVSSKVWWLDVENASLASGPNSAFPGAYWSDSTSLNDETIQGTLDALHQGGVTAGIYSTSVQFKTIAGKFTPNGPRIPLWIAGVPWTRPPFSERGLDGTGVLARWCAGTASYGGPKDPESFAGGVPWLLQETPGNEPAPYGLDPDYSC